MDNILSTDILTSPYSSIVFISVITFSILTLMMIILFGMSTASFLNEKKSMLAVLLLLIATPIAASSLQTRKDQKMLADYNRTRVTLTAEKIDENNLKLRILTAKPETVFIKLINKPEEKIVLPDENSGLTINHTFILPNTEYYNNRIIVVINGREFELIKNGIKY